MMLGNQEPTARVCAGYSKTSGDLAIELADAYGLPPLEWQRQVLRDWLAVGPDGRLANPLCLLCVPRQNGKTGVSDPRETYGLVVEGEWILHTAQEFQTAQKAFDRLRTKFGTRKNDPYAKYPELNALVKRYTTSANQMVLDLTTGGHIEFRTRGSNSDMGRGGTFDLIVIDEAQSYTDEQDAALSPLNSAAPHGSPQTILMGTVPDPRRPQKGRKFADMRATALDGAPGTCIHEWGASDVGDVADKARWYECNPSLGYHLLEKGLAKDLVSMGPETFAMEHLGWWPPVSVMKASRPVISEDEWHGCAVDEAPPENLGADAFGVRFDPEGREVCLAAAVVYGQRVYVEVAARRSMGAGLQWLAQAIEANAQSSMFVVDGKSAAGSLMDRVDGKVPKGTVIEAGTAGAISAAAGLLNEIREKSLAHVGTLDDSDQLSHSAVTSTRRPIGRSGGWGFGGEDPLPIEAAALAVWGARQVESSRQDEMEVYF